MTLFRIIRTSTKLHLQASRTTSSNSCRASALPGRTCRRSLCLSMSTLPDVRVLVDMDGVIADFERQFLDDYREKYPDEPYVEVHDRKGFYISDQYDKIKPNLREKCYSIFQTPGFFLNLPPIPGGLEAVREMDQMQGVEVFICTAPIKAYTYCVTEKFQWIDKYLGKEFVSKLILTRDKTVANGDLLIDDKPEITGAEKNPIWEHILFTTPQNSAVNKPEQRRLNGWRNPDDWREIIESKRQEKLQAISNR